MSSTKLNETHPIGNGSNMSVNGSLAENCFQRGYQGMLSA